MGFEVQVDKGRWYMRRGKTDFEGESIRPAMCVTEGWDGSTIVAGD
jgi:hypothetical protein